MRVYISGPISGRPAEEWRAEFNAAERKLAEQGHTVENPVSISGSVERLCENGGRKPSYGDYMRMDLYILLSCDAIAMLPGWLQSKGARIELSVAEACGLEVMEVPA